LAKAKSASAPLSVGEAVAHPNLGGIDASELWPRAAEGDPKNPSEQQW